MYMYILNVTTGMQATSANHLFLLHYELHTEVKPVHWPSVGMLSVENVLICNSSKQKCFKLEMFLADILTEKSSQRLHCLKRNLKRSRELIFWYLINYKLYHVVHYCSLCLRHMAFKTE